MIRMRNLAAQESAIAVVGFPTSLATWPILLVPQAVGHVRTRSRAANRVGQAAGPRAQDENPHRAEKRTTMIRKGNMRRPLSPLLPSEVPPCGEET